MAMVEFTNLNKAGYNGIEERFPGLLDEKYGKTRYTTVQWFSPKRIEGTEDFKIEVTRKTFKVGKYRDTEIKKTVTPIRLPAEWVDAKIESNVYRGPLNDMLSFRS